jgi:hypothetical protein
VVAGAVEAGRSQAVNNAPRAKTTNKINDTFLLIIILLLLVRISARWTTRSILGVYNPGYGTANYPGLTFLTLLNK